MSALLKQRLLCIRHRSGSMSGRLLGGPRAIEKRRSAGSPLARRLKPQGPRRFDGARRQARLSGNCVSA